MRIKILTALSLICATCSFFTASAQKLIVNIVIDGLKSDNLEELYDEFGEGGFRKIISEGAYSKTMTFPYLNVGRAADYAAYFTGTLPSLNGITADTYFDPKTRQIYSCLYDPKAGGINTSKQISTVSLSSSTLADELRMHTRGKSKTVSVGIDAEEVAIMSGHTGKAVWISDENSLWSTSNYFSELLPFWAVKANNDGHAASYLDKEWTNLYSVSYYRERSAQKKNSSFFAYDPVNLEDKTKPAYLKSSPYVNTMVRELGESAVREEYLGVDDYPDMLNLQFTVRGANQSTAGSFLTAEVQDMYYRLDMELQTLISDLDELCGAGEVLYMITAPQEEYVSPERMKLYGIPCGYFYSDRSMALLSTNLMARHGQGDFITGYYHRQIFLDRAEIEAKGLDFDSIADEVTEFMQRFEGVQTAYRAGDMEKITTQGDDLITKAKNTFTYGKSGDIIIYLKPGWVDVKDEEEKVGLSSRVNNYAPLIFYGWNVNKMSINHPVSALDIAPTLSLLLRLPFTNANIGNPIYEIIR